MEKKNANGNDNDNANVNVKTIGKANESGGEITDNNCTDTTVTNEEVGQKSNCFDYSGYNGTNNNKNNNNSNKGNSGRGFLPIYVPMSHMVMQILMIMVIHNMVI